MTNVLIKKENCGDAHIPGKGNVYRVEGDRQGVIYR